MTCYRKGHINTQITQKGINYSARDSELGTIGFRFNNEGLLCSVSTSARFSVVVGNTFLGTVVPKPSIKDHFLPLQIRKSEQLVPLLAKNDHFVPKKHQSKLIPTSPKGTQRRRTVCSCFSRRERSKIKKGDGSEKQNVRKNIITQKGKKAKKRLKDHFEEQNRMPKLHWTK